VQLPSIRLGGQQVAPRHHLVALGMTPYRMRTAVRAGRWQEPLPGVFVGHSGPLTRLERWHAALHFAGDAAALSHRSALLAWGAKTEELTTGRRAAGVRGEYAVPQEGGLVEVTVPQGHHLRSRNFVVVHQSRRPVADGVTVGGLKVCSPSRAAVDVAVTVQRRRDVDHVISDVLQRGLCTVTDLEMEAALLGRRLTAWLRQAIGEARRGMRSVGEADLRRALVQAGVPEPEWGAPIETRGGTYFVDAYWRHAKVAAEADGASFHLSAAAWSSDLERQNAIQSLGVRMFRFPVRRLRADPLGCGLELLPLVA
jgi:hypothetical protein